MLLFQLCFIRSSTRDLNLNCREARMETKDGLSWQPQRASVVSLMYTICIEGSSRQFDTLLTRFNRC